VVEEILVKHLLPHYVSLNWAYVARTDRGREHSGPQRPP
jgi:hypothetical protein